MELVHNHQPQILGYSILQHSVKHVVGLFDGANPNIHSRMHTATGGADIREKTVDSKPHRPPYLPQVAELLRADGNKRQNQKAATATKQSSAQHQQLGNQGLAAGGRGAVNQGPLSACNPRQLEALNLPRVHLLHPSVCIRPDNRLGHTPVRQLRRILPQQASVGLHQGRQRRAGAGISHADFAEIIFVWAKRACTALLRVNIPCK
mmetsp:Transcript_56785/g.130625  ORF Transcript_56785/g.130625 Transcript_56785/m.130625 type:complete len:206 (+) Transcript_56785:1906-2523(+)